MNELADFCRICMIETSCNSDKAFYSIDPEFESKFFEITNVKLAKARTKEEETKFSTKVCDPCKSKLSEVHNYRFELIWTQKRWNAFLGIKSDDLGKQTIATSPIKSEASKTRSIQYEPKQLQEEDEVTEQPEELEEKLENAKIEQESETEDQINYEEIFQSEDEEDQPEYENAETSDQLLDDQFPMEDEYEDDEVDTTIDQLEEEYQEETEDVGIAYVKSPDEEYVVYEEDIAMEEYSQPAKRKYAKAPKDNQKSFECWIKNCGASFSFRATIVKHMHQVHGIIVDKSMCVKCGEKFENYVDFLAHVKIHTRKTECNVCKMTFISQDKLVSHMKRSHKKNDDEDRNYQCHICEARFKRKEHVNSHIIYKHSDKSARKFSCKECPSVFLTRQDLKNHEKSHSQVMIKCNYCTYECRDLKSIKRHCLKLHNTKNVYKCVCEDGFEVFRDFQFHKKNCTGIADMNNRNDD